MFGLQFLQGFPDIPYLVGLDGFAVPLQVDKRISGPRRLENVVTAANPGLSEVLATKVQQVIEAHVLRIIQKAFVHANMIAYMISYFNIIQSQLKS